MRRATKPGMNAARPRTALERVEAWLDGSMLDPERLPYERGQFALDLREVVAMARELTKMRELLVRLAQPGRSPTKSAALSGRATPSRESMSKRGRER